MSASLICKSLSHHKSGSSFVHAGRKTRITNPLRLIRLHAEPPSNNNDGDEDPFSTLAKRASDMRDVSDARENAHRECTYARRA